jgi:hypothetical protein
MQIKLTSTGCRLARLIFAHVEYVAGSNGQVLVCRFQNKLCMGSSEPRKACSSGRFRMQEKKPKEDWYMHGIKHEKDKGAEFTWLLPCSRFHGTGRMCIIDEPS